MQPIITFLLNHKLPLTFKWTLNVYQYVQREKECSVHHGSFSGSLDLDLCVLSVSSRPRLQTAGHQDHPVSICGSEGPEQRPVSSVAGDLPVTTYQTVSSFHSFCSFLDLSSVRITTFAEYIGVLGLAGCYKACYWTLVDIISKQLL